MRENVEFKFENGEFYKVINCMQTMFCLKDSLKFNMESYLSKKISMLVYVCLYYQSHSKTQYLVLEEDVKL